MIETTKYLNALKEIADFDKSNKLNLDKEIVAEIIRQIGIDYRLQNKDNPTKHETKESIKEFIPATEGQVQALKNMNKFKEGLSKSEAWNIIHESSNKKEQEY